MTTAPAIDDLFGHVPQKRSVQGDVEDGLATRDWRDTYEADYLVRTPVAPDKGHTADTIRAQVMKIMAVVRDADTMPFNAGELHNHNVWMPYYCEWLKNGEGDALLAEYRDHMRRLEVTA